MHARWYQFKSSVVVWGVLIAFGSSLEAAVSELHFWPTPVVPYDHERDGGLFGWPEFQVTLHQKNNAGSYTEAAIDDDMARSLNIIFAPKAGSPIQTVRGESSSSWGVTIPGGSALSEANAQLIDPMLTDFIACLGTLDEGKLDRMKEVIYQPASFIANNGVALDQDQTNIAAEMYATYQGSRCKNSRMVVPELMKSKSRIYLTAMLTGNRTAESSEGALLVLSTAFKDLLFGAKGLFVRVALAKIQGFLTERLKVFPALPQGDWFSRNYESFIEYILLTEEEEGFSKEHYLRLGEACGIKTLNDAFKPFPLKSMIADGTLRVITLNLGTTQSTHFFARGPQ